MSSLIDSKKQNAKEKRNLFKETLQNSKLRSICLLLQTYNITYIPIRKKKTALSKYSVMSYDSNSNI